MFRSAEPFHRGDIHFPRLWSVFSAILFCIAAVDLAADYEFSELRQGITQVRSSVPSESTGIGINNFLGADRFYNASITGQSAIAANIEPGHIWPGHETLGHVSSFSHHNQAYGSTTSDLYDRHATWVSMLIGGRKGGTTEDDFQTGISPGADLRSGAINTAWTGSAYSMAVNFNWNTFTTPFNTYFGTADVINSSWAGGDPAGTNQWVLLLDSMVYNNPRTTYVVAAGNAGPAANTVGWPGSGYNTITVGALGNANAYDRVASFSSRGPQDYSDSINGMIAGVRAAVDISAPGTDIKTAHYGGQTGGNNPSLGGSPNGITGGPSTYTTGHRGASLSSAIVTGGAALLASASYNTPALSNNPSSRDGRIIKAVLLNSAEKTSGWDNGQTLFGSGVETTQSLDYKVGAGRINLDRAYDQYLSGTTDVDGQTSGHLGSIETEGWDFGQVSAGTANDYYISTPLKAGTDFSATLTWFRNRTSFGSTAYDNGQSDLDLIIFDATGGVFSGEISRSISDYNVVEHLYFAVPNTGYYGIRIDFDGVLFGSQTSEEYGLAWSSDGLFVSGTWAVDANGNWSHSANWAPSRIPAGVGAAVTLGDVITSARKVTFDQNVAIGSLVLNSPYGYTIFDGMGVYEMTLEAASGIVNIDVIQGDHVLDVGITVAGNLSVNVFTGSLELTNFQPLNLGGQTINKTGYGALRLGGISGGGNVIVQQGQLFFSGTHLGGGFYAVGHGTVMVGEGLILGDIINSGIFSVGPTASSSGLVVSGDFAQDSNGLMQLELAGSNSHDTLFVGGTLTAGGTFRAKLSGGYMPEAGEQFHLLSFGAASGTFTTVDLPTLGQGLMWDANGLLTNGMLEVLLAVLLGDANNDNQITGADLIIVQQNFGNVDPNVTTNGLFLGDANDDGQVTGADLIIVQQNFGNTLGPVGAAVPEPASACLLTLAGLGVMARRRDEGAATEERARRHQSDFLAPVAAEGWKV